MFKQMIINIGFVGRTLCLLTLLISVGCAHTDENDYINPKNPLSVQSVDIVPGGDWATRSDDSQTEETKFVKLVDSLLLYARMEPIATDTTSVVTRGMPTMNVNDLSDIRINLYNTGANNWTTSSDRTEAIRVSRSGKVYICAPAYNWSSKTDKVSLLSYTPISSATNGLSESANGNTITYSVPTDVTKQPDFCATNPDVDVVNSDGIRHQRSLILYHQLTAVGFAINGWNVKVSKIEISGVAFRGTFSLSTSIWSGNTTIGSDSRSLGVNTSKVPTDYYNDQTAWTDITRSNGYLMMIPQTLTDKAQVKITYTDAAGKEQTTSALLREMTSGKWEAGYKITYCIQLETAPSIGTDPITLYMPWKAGYTTTNPIPFVVRDPQDRYTFKWSESWNVIHRGPAKVNNTSGGSGSGWYTDALNTTPIWFYTRSDNPSTTSSRSSEVTLDAWRTVDRTFTVVQGMKPNITVEGLPPTNVPVPEAGIKTTVTIKSNYPWESTSSNITLNPSSGAANTTGQRVEVTIKPGDGSEGAINAIFKTTNDNKVPNLIATTSYSYTREIVLTINPTGPDAEVNGMGNTYTVDVSTGSSTSWTTSQSTGITVSPSSGKGKGKVTITVAANPSKVSSRDLKVNFLAGGSVKAVWNGTQEARAKGFDYRSTAANVYVSYKQYGEYPDIIFNALKKPISKYRKGSLTIVDEVGYNPSTNSADVGLENNIIYQSGDKIEVDWQTAVNHTHHDAPFVIKSIELATDGTAVVEVNGVGNAVLVYKRSNGTILWSYHIWVTETNPFVNHYNAGGNTNGTAESGAPAKFMDRNLGALDATTTRPTIEDAYKYFGMQYKHSLKSPFVTQGQYSSIDIAPYVYDQNGKQLYWGSNGVNVVNTAINSVITTIQNSPLNYYTAFNYNIVSLWSDYSNNSKSIYDPCPYGYRVPMSGSFAGFNGVAWNSYNLNGGIEWNNTWWPASGWRFPNNGQLVMTGGDVSYWTSTLSSSSNNIAYSLKCTQILRIDDKYEMNRGTASSIRCVQEGY